MKTESLNMRIDQETKARLQAEAAERGIVLTTRATELLTTGITVPPHVLETLENFRKHTGITCEDSARRALIWFFAMIEAGIQMSGHVDGMLASAPFVKFKRELNDEEFFAYAVGTVKATMELREEERKKNLSAYLADQARTAERETAAMLERDPAKEKAAAKTA